MSLGAMDHLIGMKWALSSLTRLSPVYIPLPTLERMECVQSLRLVSIAAIEIGPDICCLLALSYLHLLQCFL